MTPACWSRKIGSRVLDRPECGLQVGAEDLVVILLFDVLDGVGASQSGIVQQNVKTAEALDRRLYHGPGPVERAEVPGRSNGLPSLGVDLGCHLLGSGYAVVHSEVADDDLGALPGHQHGFGPTDTLTAAGDDGYLAGEALFFLVCHRSCVDQPAMPTPLIRRNSSMPIRPPSLPTPLRPIPPYGRPAAMSAPH